MNAPTTAQELTPAQQAAQETIEKQDYQKMLSSCIPTLRSELYAAEYMSAELNRNRDVQNRKRKFMKAAARIDGGIPPMTETALQIIAAHKRG